MNLADEACEDALYGIAAFRDFCSIDLGRECVPDATMLLNFRHLLEKHKIGTAIFAKVGELLLVAVKVWALAIVMRVQLARWHYASVIASPGGSGLAVGAAFAVYAALWLYGWQGWDEDIPKLPGIWSWQTIGLGVVLCVIGWFLGDPIVWAMLGAGSMYAGYRAVEQFVPNSELGLGILLLAAGFIAFVMGIAINWWLRASPAEPMRYLRSYGPLGSSSGLRLSLRKPPEVNSRGPTWHLSFAMIGKVCFVLLCAALGLADREPFEYRAPKHGVDLAAIARGHRVRRHLPLLDSRPGQHLREAPGRIDQGAGPERAEIAAGLPEGELDLRARDRNNAAGVPGLADPDVRGASALNSEILGRTLQPRQTAQQSGPRCTRSAGYAGEGPKTGSPPSTGGGRYCALESGAGWTAS